MTRRKLLSQLKSLPLRQRQRRHPSRVKSRALSRATPGENLRLALELSDFCLALRKAARQKD